MITRRQQLFGLAASTGALLAGAGPAFAAEVPVAVAANFTDPAKEIGEAFKRATGHTAVFSFGSSGQLYTQITQGAPFQVLLSADADRPAKAETDNLAVAGTRFTYAVGRLVLYSKTAGLVDDKGAVLSSNRFAKIAIADPAAAPYGVASIRVMENLGVYNTLRPKIVMGTSITQAYQFVDTGSAELGFIALSQVINIKGGSRWIVPTTLHAPIAQQAILLKTGQSSAAARAFLDFLKSRTAQAIVRKYGYELP